MEQIALKIAAYTLIGLIALRLAVVAAAIPVAWGAGLYMTIRMIAKHMKRGAST